MALAPSMKNSALETRQTIRRVGIVDAATVRRKKISQLLMPDPQRLLAGFKGTGCFSRKVRSSTALHFFTVSPSPTRRLAEVNRVDSGFNVIIRQDD